MLTFIRKYLPRSNQHPVSSSPCFLILYSLKGLLQWGFSSHNSFSIALAAMSTTISTELNTVVLCLELSRVFDLVPSALNFFLPKVSLGMQAGYLPSNSLMACYCSILQSHFIPVFPLLEFLGQSLYYFSSSCSYTHTHTHTHSFLVVWYSF